MAPSPADERKALARMKKEAKALLRKKPSASAPAPRANRFSAPIGLDDAGQPFGAEGQLPSDVDRANTRRDK